MPGALLLGTLLASAVTAAGWAFWLAVGAPAPGTVGFAIWGLLTCVGGVLAGFVGLARAGFPRATSPLALLPAAEVASASLAGLLWAAGRSLGLEWVAWSTPTAALLAGWLGWRAARLAGRKPMVGYAALGGALAGLAVLALLPRPGSALAPILGDIPRLLAAFGGLALALGVGLQRRPGWIAWILGALLAIAASVGAITFVSAYDEGPGLARATTRSRALAVLVGHLATFFDRDGDGFARRLGGGDCDDADPAVHPSAAEVPANGRDDDCFDGDAPAPAPPPAPEPTPAEPLVFDAIPVRPPNLVLITIDTVRADRMGFLGYARPTTPNLDRLAERALVFEWAFSQGPQTRMSMPSVFTGRYMSEVERTAQLWARILPENVTIAERLRDAGYRTAAVPSHRYFLPTYGLHQGFTDYDLSVVEAHGTLISARITGGEVTDRALAWLAEHGAGEAPYFLWVHYFDPHHPYQDHDGVDFGEDAADLYDEEIWYTDQQIGRLLAALDEDTAVAVHGDHAEAFGEHDYTHHGQTLLNDQVHIPLLLAAPGVPGRRIATPVSNIDLAPTLLDLAGAPSAADLRGASLLAFAHDDPPWAPVLIEMIEDPGHAPRKALVAWPWKIHWLVKKGYFQLYDLTTDPTEQRNVVMQNKATFKAEHARIRRFVARNTAPATPR